MCQLPCSELGKLVQIPNKGTLLMLVQVCLSWCSGGNKTVFLLLPKINWVKALEGPKETNISQLYTGNAL